VVQEVGARFAFSRQRRLEEVLEAAPAFGGHHGR
jgi:hypothetical protein